jgi:prepilin-type N-terminal cleavage/methylation domain-containing protein/prepilin-type processing-associated H-X9-DG protein
MQPSQTCLKHLTVWKHHGFTLVEMAVVIVIMAFVMSLSFSAFGAVKRKSSQAACAFNMKQVGTSIVLFATENDGWLPPGPAGQTINTFISDSRFGGTTQNVVDKSNLEYYLTNYIAVTYIDSKKKANAVFSCPAHDAQHATIWKRGSCFGGAGGAYGIENSKKLIALDNDDYFLVDFTKAFTNHSASATDKTMKNPHGSMRNLLRADGSVTTELDNKAR